MSISKKFINDSTKKFLIRTKSSMLLKEFIDEILSYMSSYRAVYCDNIEEFAKDISRGELFEYSPHVIILRDLTKDDVKPILDMLNLSTEDILVIVEKGSVLRSKEYTYLKSICDFLEIKDPDARSCSSWARRYLNAAGIKFVEGVPSYIVQKKGNDLDAIKNEIDKLSLIYKNESITTDVCDRVVSVLSGVNMFDFIDFFFKKKMQEAIEEFRKVPEVTYVQFLHFIIGQVERIFKIAVYKEQRLSADEISEIIGVPKFIVKTKLLTAVAFYNKMKLVQVLDLLNVLDYELRTSKYNKRLIFEAYLVKALKL